jgi:hypothetical protein
MPDRRAMYVGPSQTGIDLTVELANGETRNVHVPHGGDVPTEIDGMKVPATFRDGLLEQKDNFSLANRAVGDEVKGKAADAKDGE